MCKSILFLLSLLSWQHLTIELLLFSLFVAICKSLVVPSSLPRCSQLIGLKARSGLQKLKAILFLFPFAFVFDWLFHTASQRHKFCSSSSIRREEIARCMLC